AVVGTLDEAPVSGARLPQANGPAERIVVAFDLESVRLPGVHDRTHDVEESLRCARIRALDDDLLPCEVERLPRYPPERVSERALVPLDVKIVARFVDYTDRVVARRKRRLRRVV